MTEGEDEHQAFVLFCGSRSVRKSPSCRYKSIGYSEGASGTYVANVLLKKLGIADEVAPKCKIILGQRFVGEALASGEVEIGLQQIDQ
jgi:hypothetical protein